MLGVVVVANLVSRVELVARVEDPVEGLLSKTELAELERLMTSGYSARIKPTMSWALSMSNLTGFALLSDLVLVSGCESSDLGFRDPNSCPNDALMSGDTMVVVFLLVNQ